MTTDKDGMDSPVSFTDNDVTSSEDYDEENLAPILEEDHDVHIDDLEVSIMPEESPKLEDVIIHSCAKENEYL